MQLFKFRQEIFLAESPNSYFFCFLIFAMQDTYGNTVLHMVVIVEQLGMFGYALKHPIRKVSFRDSPAFPFIQLRRESLSRKAGF
jgi:hypothetical protein